jgi:hypothetical protein
LIEFARPFGRGDGLVVAVPPLDMLRLLNLWKTLIGRVLMFNFVEALLSLAARTDPQLRTDGRRCPESYKFQPACQGVDASETLTFLACRIRYPHTRVARDCAGHPNARAPVGAEVSACIASASARAS